MLIPLVESVVDPLVKMISLSNEESSIWMTILLPMRIGGVSTIFNDYTPELLLLEYSYIASIA